MTKKQNSNIIVPIVIVLGLVIGGFVIMAFLVEELNPTLDARAKYGDSFGLVNSLFSALAFAAIIISLFFQKKELEIQIQEVRTSNIELKQSNEFLGKQIKILAKSNDANVVIGLFNEFRDKKWTTIRNLMNESRRNGEALEFDKVREYSHFLNHFGFLLEHGYIDIRPLYETFGRGAMEFWRLYKKDIKKERNHSDSLEEYRPYQYHLEYLDWELRKYFDEGRRNIEKLQRKINDWDQNER